MRGFMRTIADQLPTSIDPSPGSRRKSLRIWKLAVGRYLMLLLALGLMGGDAHAQSVGIPKTFQPSLDAARSRRQLKNPPLTAAPDVKTTLYRIGDALGMLRDVDERDAIL